MHWGGNSLSCIASEIVLWNVAEWSNFMAKVSISYSTQNVIFTRKIDDENLAKKTILNLIDPFTPKSD